MGSDSERLSAIPFSERFNLKGAVAIQTNSIDTALRNSLWNLFLERFWPNAGNQPVFSSPEGKLLRSLWTDVFKKLRDDLDYYLGDAVGQFREVFLACEWFLIYEAMEYVVVDFFGGSTDAQRFITRCNQILAREHSGYRFVGSRLSPIVSEVEIVAIEAAFSASDAFRPVAVHVESALALLSNREKPDYRNSIKESISAVEAACKIITGDNHATLGVAIKNLKSKGVDMHPAFEGALSKMYGYTSNAEGIRHALLSESSVDASDATFMLVTCSAFVNYLKAKSAGASGGV